jgi:hypothetical protein
MKEYHCPAVVNQEEEDGSSNYYKVKKISHPIPDVNTLKIRGKDSTRKRLSIYRKQLVSIYLHKITCIKAW